MAFRIECPGCQAKLTIPDDLQGKRVRCPKCNKPILAERGLDSPTKPAPAKAAVKQPKASEAIAANRPGQTRPSEKILDKEAERKSSVKASRSFRDDEFDEESEDRPKRRRAQQQSATPWLIAGVGGGVALVGAIIVAILIGGSGPSKPEPAAQADPPAPVARPVKASAKSRQPVAEAPPTDVALPAGPTPREIDQESVKRVKKATAYLRVKLANGSVVQGSGFFAAEKGLVFTNAHVLGMLNPSAASPSLVEIVTNSGERGEKTRHGKILGVDRESDLGVLRITGDEGSLPDPLPLDSALKLSELQKVYVFGFPFGEGLGKNITISESAVSSIRKNLDGSVDQVQVNGGIHPGNSGGPVVDSRGVVIGVSVAGIRGTTINFAVPGERVQGLLSGRVAELTVGAAYVKDAETKLPIEIDCLDPMNRLQSVKIDVWTGNQGLARPSAMQKPAAAPGDGPHQSSALVYKNNKATAEIALPAMSASQTFWLQPIVTDKYGKTQWATAVPFKAADHAPVERKPAMLQLRVEPQPERTLKIVNSNKFVFYNRKKQEALSFNVEAQALEIAQKDPQGALYRLTLDEPKFALNVNEKAVTPDSKAQVFFRGKFMQFITKPTGDLVVRGQSSLSSSTAANVRTEFDAKLNQVANAYEMTCLTFPNREMKAKETWTTVVPILLGSGAKKDRFDMHLTCTMEGCREASGENQAVISMRGTLKNHKEGVSQLYGKVTGKGLFAVDRGYLSQARIKLDYDAEFGDQSLASYIIDVDLTRVPGNTANITPSKDKPAPTYVKGKSVLQVTLSTLGPGDMTNYPGKLAIPYKFWHVPFVGGKTYIIEMSKTGTDTIDPYLILHNPLNVKVAEDDDGAGEQNARIVYHAPVSGIYHIFATTLMVNQGGNFQLFAWEAAPERKTDDPKAPNTKSKKAAPKGDAPKGDKALLKDKGTTGFEPFGRAHSALYVSAYVWRSLRELEETSALPGLHGACKFYTSTHGFAPALHVASGPPPLSWTTGTEARYCGLPRLSLVKNHGLG